MSDERDPKLGAALAELPVPEHREGFWDDVRGEVAAQARRARRVRRVVRSRLGALGPLLLALVAIVALVAFVLLGNDDRRDDPDRGSRPAATTLPRVAPAGLPQMVSGTAVITMAGDPEATQRVTVTRAVDGSFVEVDEATGDTNAYDASADRSVAWYAPAEGGRPAGTIETRLAPGGPDPTARAQALDAGVADFVVGAALDGSPLVEDIEVDGRAAWRYAGPVGENELAGTGVDHVEAVVDRETGVLRRLVERDGQRVVRTVDVQGFRAHARLDRSVFSPVPPGTATMRQADAGFRRSTRDELATLGVVVPLYAEDVVAGHALDGVWVQPGEGAVTGPEGMNPPSRDVVSLLYRDGWRRVVVTVRRLVGGRDAWVDPFAAEGQRLTGRSPLSLPGDGAYAGSEGEVVLDPQTVPHAWAVTCGSACDAEPEVAGVVITASGAAPPDRLVELLQVARTA